MDSLSDMQRSRTINDAHRSSLLSANPVNHLRNLNASRNSTELRNSSRMNILNIKIVFINYPSIKPLIC